jgi:hypothetical protein
MKNTDSLIQTLAAIGKALGDKNQVLDSFQELLLRFVEDPMTEAQYGVVYRTKTGGGLYICPARLGTSPKEMEESELAAMLSVRGAGYRPLSVLSHGVYHAGLHTGGSCPVFYARCFDSDHLFSAEWMTCASKAKIAISNTPEKFSQLFRVEHETADH